MQDLQQVIEQAAQRTDYSPSEKKDLAETVSQVIALLNVGELRVAEKQHSEWRVNAWVKQAILYYFQQENNVLIDGGVTPYFDKIPLKFSTANAASFTAQDIRVVPTALVRYGAYIAPKTVLMPCYVNIGAYVDSGSLIDTWATVSSCAQVGKNVHLSGGAGLGGVLEPIHASPVIIEDHCFIGARAEIVEGVIVETHAVIAMGVFIGQSTPIYNRETREITYGRVPAGSVVVPGSLPAKDGSHSLACAVIVKQVDDRTRGRIALNEVLRELAEVK